MSALVCGAGFFLSSWEGGTANFYGDFVPDQLGDLH